MKLPEIKSGAVRPLQGAPSISEGMAAGKMVQQVGKQISDTAMDWHKALSDEKHRQNVHNARVAKFEMDEELNFTTQALASEQYMEADDPLLVGVEGYTTRANGKVLTSEVAPLIIAARMDDMVQRYGDSITDGRTKDSWVADQRASVSRTVGQLAVRASQIALQDRREEGARMTQAMVDNQNWAGARTQVQASLMAGDIDETEANEHLTKIGNQEEITTNSEAINDRNLKAINSRINEMGKSQEKYTGHLRDENKRLTEKARLERARKAILDGYKVQNEAQAIRAQMLLDKSRDAYLSGSDVTGEQYALAREKYDGLAWGHELSKSEIRKKYQHDDTLMLLEHGTTLAKMSHAEADNYLNSLRSDDPISNAFLVDLRNLNNAYNDRRDADPASLAEEQGLLPKTQFDMNDLVTSLQTERDHVFAAQRQYGTTDKPQVIRPARMQAFMQAFNSADLVGRTDMINQVGQAYGDDPDSLHQFWVQGNFESGDHSWVTAVAASRGNLGLVRDQMQGAELRHSTAEIARLKQQNLDNSGINAALNGHLKTLSKHYPLTAGPRFEALKDIVVSRVLTGGQDVRQAGAEAMKELLGGTLVQQPGFFGKEVLAPEPDMSKQTWRDMQTGIGDDYYRDIGYVGTGSLRQRIKDGDAMFQNTELGPSKYMVINEAGAPILDKDYRPLIVDVYNGRANVNRLDEYKETTANNAAALEKASQASQRVTDREARMAASRQARDAAPSRDERIRTSRQERGRE